VAGVEAVVAHPSFNPFLAGREPETGQLAAFRASVEAIAVAARVQDPGHAQAVTQIGEIAKDRGPRNFQACSQFAQADATLPTQQALNPGKTLAALHPLFPLFRSASSLLTS